MVHGILIGDSGSKTPPGWRHRMGDLSRGLAISIARAADFALEQRRFFLLVPFALILGLIGYRIMPGEPTGTVWIAGTIFVTLCAIAFRSSGVSRRLVLFLTWIWIGTLVLPLHGALWGTKMLEAPRYGIYEFTIDQIIFDDGNSQRWIVSQIVADQPRNDPGVNRARLATRDIFAVEQGDTISARVRFSPVPPPIVPGGYDAQFVSYFQSIGAYGSVLGNVEVHHTIDTGFAEMVAWVRAEIGARILTVLDDRIGGVATALITGDQSRLDPDERAVMASAGLAHVLAISGLHLTIAAGSVFAVLRLVLSAIPGIAEHYPIKRIAAFGGITTAFAYLFISGMGISAIRATIMLCLVFGAVMAGRHALTMRNVAIAAILIVLVDPASIFRASFQLSFAAVIALIAAFELARDSREKKTYETSKLLRFFKEIGVTSIIAGAATMLFTAYHFQQTAPFGLLGNLMAMPIVTLVMMPSALIATLMIPFGLEGPFYLIMGWSIEAVLWCAHFVQTVSFGFDPSPILAPSALVVGLVALAWLAFFQCRIRIWGPALAVPVIFAFCTEPSPDVLIADSTQATVVRHEGALALIAGRNNTFATNVWSERYIESIASRHDVTNCDGLGCVISASEGYTVALVRDPAAFNEDCALADLVITRMPAPPSCSDMASAVIDETALSTHGTHMLYWNRARQTFRIKPTVPDPNRPWRPTYVPNGQE